MTSQTLKHAIGIFYNRQDAEQALGELKDTGFPMHKISVITKSSDIDHELDDQGVQQLLITRTEAAKAGAASGSIGVGSLTLIAGLTSLLIPGIGQALAVESLLTTLFGSGVAATAGGLYGALQGWLVPEEQARICSDKFKRGDSLVIMEAIEDEVLMAEPILKYWGIRTWHVYNAS